MNERDRNPNEETEIDIRKLMRALLDQAWLLVVCAIIGASGVLLATLLLTKPQYQSSAMLYVNNSPASSGEAAQGGITSADIAASKNLVDSYIVILQSRESLEAVIACAGIDRTYEELRDMICAAAVNSTEVFRVTVTSTDPQEAERIANAIAYVLPERIAGIIEGTSARIVESAVAACRPSSPEYRKNALLGLLLGLFTAAGFICLRTVTDTTIRTQEDIARNCAYPVLAAVPEIGRSSASAGEKRPMPIGSGMGAASMEAYKLLRTKLRLSFANDRTARVIGVSSAVSGEGKSLTALNLACSLTQLGKKVLMVDCNMRRSALTPAHSHSRKPGLADFLAGKCGLEETIRYCGIKCDRIRFPVITAGECPPNPIELLSSDKMSELLADFREVCDYVILDLPPAGEVSDALAVAKETDGILLVVRRDYCSAAALRETTRQLEFAHARILGVVFNSAAGSGRKRK